MGFGHSIFWVGGAANEKFCRLVFFQFYGSFQTLPGRLAWARTAIGATQDQTLGSGKLLDSAIFPSLYAFWPLAANPTCGRVSARSSWSSNSSVLGMIIAALP